MSDISAESNSLPRAMQFCQAMAKQADEAIPNVERAKADLTASEVTGRPIDGLAVAMEILADLRESFQAADAALSEQLTAREALQANQEAGSKDFLTGE